MYVVSSYTFEPGGSGVGTITIPGTLRLEDLGVITNVTRNSVIYSPSEGQAGASLSYGEGETILTLEQNTAYCDSTDKLQIIVLQSSGGETGEGATEETLLSVDNKLPELVGGKIPVDIGTSVEVSNDVGNPIPTSVPARTPTTTSVSSVASSVTILGTNLNRKGFSISNISTSKLYLSFSSPATTANCFIEIPAGAFLLLDQQLIVTSAIYGIWASANGTAQVTEYV
jgi:hypothetical protein